MQNSYSGGNFQDHEILEYINLKLAALGCPVHKNRNDDLLIRIARPLLRTHQEHARKLANYHCPADQRVQDFLTRYLKEIPETVSSLPSTTFTLDNPGLARIMSLPAENNVFSSDIITSYRIRQGILHNPKSDRRTTQGVFHIVEGGLPIPDDKVAVPKTAFARLWRAALTPPQELMRLPFTSAQKDQAELFVSLLIRPVVSPEVPAVMPQKSMEIRFFAPGNLISNLDFIESIFGNAGDPYLAENDAALDVEHWTGHTGCVVLAPHLIQTRKKDLGLPHLSEATERQKRDGMCWEKEDEFYNNGSAFKVTCRDANGVIVTIIADNYFGYCKKEVKTQISFAANLFGLSEEEHSGGALAFTSYDLGEKFSMREQFPDAEENFDDMVKQCGGRMDIYPQGYAIDRHYPNIIYVPESAEFDLNSQSISWTRAGKEERIKLLAYRTYITPHGYKIYTKKQTGGHAWHLIGIVPEGVLCHKPCTVSGGGKSEISKSIIDAMIQGPVFTADFQKDMALVEDVLQKDFSLRFRPEFAAKSQGRPVLSVKRSLGSVVKLLTVSPEYTDEYNNWLLSLPPHIKEILLVVKRFYRPEWGDDWRKHFGVDVVNGHIGHELKFNNRKLVANYLRIGREEDGSWRIYRVRQDFAAADKIQTADDITASVVLPRESLQGLNPDFRHASVKMIHNCERMLFQRPDDAVYRGYDKQAESDLAAQGTFVSNFEPLTLGQAQEIVEDAIHFELYTEPMKKLISDFVDEANSGYLVSSAHPRMVDGKPSKNPRYLQRRPDLTDPRKRYIAEMGTRISRNIGLDAPLYFPVNAVVPGKRNNPPDLKAGVPPLAVYNPIHYQELPELFLDFICSLTGKSPSTTGFGSEGALTKGPFNALCPVIDLNNTLVSFMVSGYQGFTSAAGYIGPKYRVDHDISLLIPEIWCRMTAKEQTAEFLIQEGYMEKVRDFVYQDRNIPASILGYRVTQKFVRAFLGRIFNNPNAVFNEEMLCPEKQDLALYAEGIENMVITQQRVAQYYFADNSIEAACPPLKALLHIMAFGHYENRGINDPEIRRLFTREYLLASDWYRKRLETKQQQDIALWNKHVAYLEKFASDNRNAPDVKELRLEERLLLAKKELKHVSSPEYLKNLNGTIGSDPFAHVTANSRTLVSAGK